MRRGALLLMLSGCTLYYGDDAPPPMNPPDDPPAPDPIAVQVAQPNADARDIAVDDQNVYWTEQWADAKGIVVRWDKATHERVELAVVDDGLPNEIELAGGYIYWTVQRGWFDDGGRQLGVDWLMRVAVDGSGSGEVVATGQTFDYSFGALGAAGTSLYWLDEGGALRVLDADATLPLVTTLRSGLDQPRVIGASASGVCFRTGHPNLDSPIYCHDTTASTLRVVGGGFPRALVFDDDMLHWVDEERGVLLAATANGPTTMLQIGPSFMVLGLARAERNFFWNQQVEYPENRDTIRMSRPDGTIATVATSSGYISAFAVDDEHVYLVDAAQNRILRADRPY